MCSQTQSVSVTSASSTYSKSMCDCRVLHVVNVASLDALRQSASEKVFSWQSELSMASNRPGGSCGNNQDPGTLMI